MGTNLRYNGVLLKNVRTVTFDQLERRDDSNTDATAWEITLAVESLCNPQILLSANPTLGATGIVGDTAAQIVAALQATLGMDRRTLVYTMDNGIAEGQPGAITTILLHAGAEAKAVQIGGDKPDPQAALHLDVDNGPKVEHLRVIQISPATIRIEFSIKVCLPVYQGLVSPSELRINNVISNRWSATEDIDELWRITRSWRGRIRVKYASTTPHDFRGIVTPPLAKGFRRERIHLNAPPNSLELEYEVVDRQMIGDAPPYPGLKMSGTHTESMEWDVTKNRGDLVLRLDGPKSADKRAMIEVALQIAVGRLQCQKENFKKTIVQNLTVTDYISDDTNAVEVRVSVIHRLPTSKRPSGDGKDAKGFSGLFTETMGKPLSDLEPAIKTDKGEYKNEVREPSLTSPSDLPRSFYCYLQTPIGKHGYLPETDTDKYVPRPSDPSQAQPLPDPPEAPKPPQPADVKALRAPDAPRVAGANVSLTDEPLSDNWPIAPFSDDDLDSPYLFCRIESEIDTRGMRVMLPIGRSAASSGASIKPIRLAPEISYRIIRFSVERLGNWPELPKPTDFTDASAIKHFIRRHTFTLQAPKLTGDGSTHLYAADAEYSYALERAIVPGSDELPTGHLQWEQPSAAKLTKVPKSSFVSPDSFPGMR